jgi:hypothetical protein
MKIKLTSPKNYPNFTGIAKRFRDMTEEEIDIATSHPEQWSGEEVFIQNKDDNCMLYLLDIEYVVIEE